MFMIKKNKFDRKGLFSDKSFDKDHVVMSLRGNKLTREDIKGIDKNIIDGFLQIGKDLFLDMGNEHEKYINHNCNPNCYIKAIVNSAFLIALRPIAKDEELTFDYSLTSTDIAEEWNINCVCHRFYCRGLITGFDSLDDKKKDEAIKNSIIPRYISSRT